MKLYQLDSDLSVCCWFRQPLNESLQWADGWFDGTPREGEYLALRAERDDEGDHPDGPLPDYTDFALRPIPTVSEQAIEILGELLAPFGEFTPPLIMDEAKVYRAFNPTTVVDLLNEERSTIKRFSDGGVMRVAQHVLLDSVQSLPPIFKMPQTRRNTTYVNEAFVARAQGLLGFKFPLLFER